MRLERTKSIPYNSANIPPSVVQFCGNNKKQNLLQPTDVNIQKALGTDNINMLKKLYHIAKGQDADVYLFGGCVRDCIAGQKIHDLDIMVNADAISFSVLMKFLEPKTFHRLFLKPSVKRAVVYTPKLHIDVKSVSSTGEKLPNGKVTKSALYKRLTSHDYTINSMLIKLSENKKGKFRLKFIDVLGGKKDLKSKRLVHIRPENFAHEPINALRGIRFLAKYNMKVEPETAKLIKNCFNGKVNKSKFYYYRVLREFVRIFKATKNPLKSLKYIIKYNGYKAIF